MDKIKLFCIPYAGGSAMIYNKWRKYLKEEIELVPLELAGRGKRSLYPHYNNIEDAVSDVFTLLRHEVESDMPYAIFGHSMGSVIAFELSYRIAERGFPLPVHLFFSGRKPPDDTSELTEYHKLPDNAFINAIKRYGGMSEEVLAERELLDFFIPIIRNDFKIVETYAFLQKKSRLDCDVSVFFGKEDSMTEQDMAEFAKYCMKGFGLYEFNGGHFFILEDAESVTDTINRVLANYL